MERLSAFQFACRACDAVFGAAYVFPCVPRPSLCDRGNPMEFYEDDMFFARYRFTKGTVRELLAFLPIEANDDYRGLPLPPMLQLLVTLRFYGAGTFQIVAGDLVNVSQPTVCRIVKKVTRLIARHLFRAVVRFPGASQMSSVMRDFYEIAHFPGVTGCIDCTHVRIKSPGGDDAEVYRNRKGVFSVNVQVVGGPQLQFFNVVASWPGSVHDSRIFDNSRVRVLYEEHRVPGILLGNMGYACFPFLMTPLADPGSANTPEGRYNKAHTKTRNSVERAFGVWKRRFPCLDMKLQHKPCSATSIITACAALHNLALSRREPEPVEPPEHHPSTSRCRRMGRNTCEEHFPPIDRVAVDVSGMRARQLLIERSFS
ncbi:putative nuclease HARBI1 [Dermacentor andersoni]|uniref:putative nuclease HARBI1 n=1 Tax=Dermacentor andersoni TaxID=34620 RepID=UPI002416592C|nr:putative nuclease HARBI1 [Dermacentor andersoni]